MVKQQRSCACRRWACNDAIIIRAAEKEQISLLSIRRDTRDVRDRWPLLRLHPTGRAGVVKPPLYCRVAIYRFSLVRRWLR